MPDAKKERSREICRQNYHLAVAEGCYLAARKYLRNALIWSSPTARSRSREWAYFLFDGKIIALEYKCSY